MLTDEERPWRAVPVAVDLSLDHIESLLMGVSQRPLTVDQAERLARLLQTAERSLLRRERRRPARWEESA